MVYVAPSYSCLSHQQVFQRSNCTYGMKILVFPPESKGFRKEPSWHSLWLEQVPHQHYIHLLHIIIVTKVDCYHSELQVPHHILSGLLWLSHNKPAHWSINKAKFLQQNFIWNMTLFTFLRVLLPCQVRTDVIIVKGVIFQFPNQKDFRENLKSSFVLSW